MKKAGCLQVVFSRAVPGVTEAAVLDAFARTQQVMDGHPALVRRELHRLGDGRWADMIWWTTAEGAQAAAALVHGSDAGRAMGALFLPDGFEVLELTPLAAAEA